MEMIFWLLTIVVFVYSPIFYLCRPKGKYKYDHNPYHRTCIDCGAHHEVFEYYGNSQATRWEITNQSEPTDCKCHKDAVISS